MLILSGRWPALRQIMKVTLTFTLHRSICARSARRENLNYERRFGCVSRLIGYLARRQRERQQIWLYAGNHHGPVTLCEPAEIEIVRADGNASLLGAPLANLPSHCP